MAYFLVHSCARSLYLFLSVLNIRAISGTSGSSGFGSVSNEQIESRTERACGKKKPCINGYNMIQQEANNDSRLVIDPHCIVQLNTFIILHPSVT